MDEQTLKAFGFDMASDLVKRRLAEESLANVKQNHKAGYQMAMEDMKGILEPVQKQIELLRKDSAE